jgi:hypothetical protein
MQEAPDDLGGRQAVCVQCDRPFEVPPATYRTVLLPWEDRPPTPAPEEDEPPPIPSAPPTRHSRPSARRQWDEREQEDEEDDYCRRPRRPRRGRYDEFRCPFCGSRDEPRITKKFGGASIALVIIGILFWPLIIIAILIQENWLTCRECGAKVRQVDGGYNF